MMVSVRSSAERVLWILALRVLVLLVYVMSGLLHFREWVLENIKSAREND